MTTPEQKARQILKPHFNPMGHSYPLELEDAVANALREERDRAIEECARIVEAAPLKGNRCCGNPPFEAFASAIRALKEKV